MKKLLVLFSVYLVPVYAMDKAPYKPGLCVHYHLEAGASRRTLELIGSQQHPVRQLPADTYDFQATGCCYQNFDAFAKAYYNLSSVIGRSEDFFFLMYDALLQAFQRGITDFECIVSPELATSCGVDWKESLHQVNTAITDFKKIRTINAGAVLTFIRGQAPVQGLKATEYIEYLVREQKRGKLEHFVGVHLSGGELDNEDYAQFQKAYGIAAAAHLGLAAHAGEWGGASNVRRVIDQLNVTRIGHGIRAIEDPAVVEYLVEKKVLLEGCPTSNICTGALPSRRYHDLPMKKLYDAGVPIYACNPDDPTLFGDVTESSEAHKLKQNLEFSDDELRHMELMGKKASFIPVTRDSVR